MPPPGQTVAASPAHDMSFPGHDHARVKIDDMTSSGFDDADELMTDLHRRRNRVLSPGIPFVDMHIGTTDRRTKNTNQDVELANRRNRHFFQPKPRTTLSFYERLHRPHRMKYLVRRVVPSFAGNFSQVRREEFGLPALAELLYTLS